MTPKNTANLLGVSAIALIMGGALTLLINALLTPAMPLDAPYSVTAASSVYAWRLALATAAAGLLGIGSIGCYLRHAEATGRFGLFAFMLAFVGSTVLFAFEWSQVFLVRALALDTPGALEELEAAGAANLFDVSAMIALLTFTMGWILFSISILRGRVYRRRGPILVIAGFFAIPILTVIVPGVWGAVIGNAVLGSGWMALGYELLGWSRTSRV